MCLEIISAGGGLEESSYDQQKIIHRVAGAQRVERYYAWVRNILIIDIALSLSLLQAEGFLLKLRARYKAITVEAAR
jgi:hypothetical protein